MHQEQAATEALNAIIEIVKDQQSLERYQISNRDSANTINDSRIYADKKIVKLAEPFIPDAGR
jgi:hypothetical protein